MCGGNRRENIFQNDGDRKVFLGEKGSEYQLDVNPMP